MAARCVADGRDSPMRLLALTATSLQDYYP